MYSDPIYLTQIQVAAVSQPSDPVTLGTITASGTATFTGTAGSQAANSMRFPVFKSPVTIKGIRVYCTTAPTSAGGVTLGFYNGTSSIGSAVITTAGVYDAVLVAPTVASNGAQTGPVFFTGSNGEITTVNTATGTASGQTLGAYAVDLIYVPLFTT